MNARLIVLGLTVCLTFLLSIPSVVIANESGEDARRQASEKVFQYDHQMVEKAPAKSKKEASVLPYTVLSWRPHL